MLKKLADIIANIAFLAIFAGIWLTDVSLGSKIIWTSVYTIFLSGITILSSQSTKVKKTLCDIKHKL